MRSNIVRVIGSTLAILALVAAGVATGWAIRSEPVVAEDPESALVAGGLAELREVHDELVKVGGMVFEGRAVSDQDAKGFLAVDHLAVVWTADQRLADELVAEGEVVLALPELLDPKEVVGDATDTDHVVVAVTPKREIRSVALVDDSGVLDWVGGRAAWSLALAGGGSELFESGYAPPPANPCEVPVVPEYRSPFDALKTYLSALGTRTELAMNRASIANIQAADRVLRDSPVSEDPVTGVPVIPSVNDISQQLKDSPEKDVARRPAVPVELLLLSPEEAEAASGTMLIFIDVQQQVVLGGFSLSTQIGGPSGEPSRSTILELAPPAPGSDVAVVRRPETGWAASCGIADAAETVMLIPYDDIAGKTRISVSLTDLTYRPVTEFDTPF